MSKIIHVGLVDLIRNDFAKRAGGFKCFEVKGFPQRAVVNTVARLLDAGFLHRAKISHRNARYFGDARLAMQFESGSRSEYVQFRHPPRGRDWDRNAPAVYPTDSKGRPLYKVTVCPSPAAPTRTNTHSGWGGV